MILSILKANKYAFILFVLHVIFWCFFLNSYGFNLGNEGEKFCGEAKQLFNGKASEVLQYQLLNLSYIFYLALLLKIGFSLKLIILFTHVVTLFSYFKFYALLVSRYTKTVALLWLAFMLTCPLLLYWNFSLYSESFFMALSLLSIYYLFKSERITFSYLVIALLLLLCRPAGIFVIFLSLFLKLVCSNKLSLKRSISFLAAILLMCFTIVFFFVPIHFNGVAKEIMNGSVICGFPEYNQPLLNEKPTLYTSYFFFLKQHGVGELVKITFLKIVSFFNITRPYYSAAHNAINLGYSIFLVSNLVCFIISFKKKFNAYFNEIIFIQLFILLNCMLVMLFFNEWTERYTLVIFPYLFFTTALLIDQFIPKKKLAI